MFDTWDNTVTGKIVTVMPAIALIGVGVFLWNTDNEPIPTIDLGILAGCYTSPGAPNWSIDGSDLKIDQANLPLMKVAMRHGKRARMVLLDHWLEPEAQADGTFVLKKNRGQNWKTDWKMNLETYPRYPARGDVKGPVRKIYLFGLKEPYSRTLPENCSSPS
ncbi:hypothetical protein [Parasphingorhabdus cellanae]|uniref:Uncharacterized protein n=1 Tax=Parasphingorhabdus cellanae TaxID=2806553 RepID=A0ABX7T819_9SPHN|nr:hypothetical protein [Parasphingorhabdus cellanae]QTD57048.1 hypothetical protein J4G78_05675 [Parasphingorhabdus cellanae]